MSVTGPGGADRTGSLSAREHGSRYLAGAAICAVANNVVLIGGDAAGLSRLVGVLLTWLTGGTIGYIWHQRITFGAPFAWRGYVQMMAGIAVGIPLTLGLLELLQGILHWPMWVAAPVTTVAMVVYNYCNARLAILHRLWKSRKDKQADGQPS